MGPIGYLGRILPTLSETFVVREVAAHWRLGLPVRLFSLYPPEDPAMHPEIRDLSLPLTTLWQPSRPAFWTAHLHYLQRRPRLYRQCWQDFLRHPDSRGPARRRCLLFLLVSPYAARCLETQGIKHLHAHFANTAASVALGAATLAGIPWSFTAHAYDVFVDTLLLDLKLRRAAFVATVSNFHVQYLREHFPGARQARLEVIRYGLDPDLFPFQLRPRREPPVILAVGRLVATKGFHTLIAALARLRRQGLQPRCRIIGEGPERPSLTTQIARLGLADQVELLGRQLPAAVKAAYDQADLLVMPSCVKNNDRDGIPNVLLEAMALGVPVISTWVSGIPELVRPEATGLLVPPEDPAALAEAIARLLQDPELAHRLARSARQLVETEFNIYRSAARLQELLAAARMPARGEE